MNNEKYLCEDCSNEVTETLTCNTCKCEVCFDCAYSINGITECPACYMFGINTDFILKRFITNNIKGVWKDLIKYICEGCNEEVNGMISGTAICDICKSEVCMRCTYVAGSKIKCRTCYRKNPINRIIEWMQNK